MQTPSNVSLKIKLDFYALCTGETAESLEDLPDRFRQVVALMDERAMRVVVIKAYLLRKRQASSETIANRYGVSGQAVRSLKSNLFRSAKEVISAKVTDPLNVPTFGVEDAAPGH
jgi:hypothetical protein